MMFTNKGNNKTMDKKFKLTELDAKDAPTKDIEWDVEEVGVDAKDEKSQFEYDNGTGQAIVLRNFDFSANPEVFKQHKPSAQELFESHRKGMEAMLWTDGLTPYHVIEPRLFFSKDNTKYRFVVSCIPNQALMDNPKTLIEIFNETKRNTNLLPRSV